MNGDGVFRKRPHQTQWNWMVMWYVKYREREKGNEVKQAPNNTCEHFCRLHSCQKLSLSRNGECWRASKREYCAIVRLTYILCARNHIQLFSPIICLLLGIYHDNPIIYHTVTQQYHWSLHQKAEWERWRECKKTDFGSSDQICVASFFRLLK